MISFLYKDTAGICSGWGAEMRVAARGMVPLISRISTVREAALRRHFCSSTKFHSSFRTLRRVCRSKHAPLFVEIDLVF